MHGIVTQSQAVAVIDNIHISQRAVKRTHPAEAFVWVTPGQENIMGKRAGLNEVENQNNAVVLSNVRLRQPANNAVCRVIKAKKWNMFIYRREERVLIAEPGKHPFTPRMAIDQSLCLETKHIILRKMVPNNDIRDK